jgi:hypothetical protein
LQCEIGVKVEPLQVAVPQETLVPPSWQCPAPSQEPVLPQGGLVAQRPCGSRLLAATLAQFPALPAMLQAWQVAHELELQQTPSTQLLLVKQSLVCVHDWPSRFLLPQKLVTVSQMSGGKQSVSTVQVALQAVPPLQTKGAQLSVVGCWQLPLPSQVRPVVSVDPPPGQEGARQEVPPAYFRQAPLPSQKPSWRQLACPWSRQVPCGSAVPFGTLVQVPGALVSAQDWQTPVQAVWQQTPWAQKPEPHSADVTHDWPGPLSPHDPLMQTAGEAQSPLVTQELLQTLTPQAYGKQDEEFGVTQLPVPSQVDVPVKVEAPLGQVDPMHRVPL